jgi:menaquinol-cytochrome c reductase iron-sulfur subunit
VAEHDEGHGAAPEEHGATEGQGPPHLPTPTIYPAAFALGIALLLIGLVVNWYVVAIGAGIAVVFGFLWARDATSGYRKQPAPPPPARLAEGEEGEAEEPERFGRNVFLERTTLALGGLIGVAVTAPVVGFAIAPAFTGQGDEDVDLGPLSNYPEGQYVVATFISNKDTGAVSRQTAFVRYNGIANGVPSFTILSNRCVHLGCPTQPNGPTETDNPKQVKTDAGQVTLIATQPAGFGCPCHGGQYDNEGNRTAGPPVRSMDRYEYKIVNGNLVLSGRYSVGKVEGTGASAKIIAYKRHDPGQHVDGGEQWFYPWAPTGGR